MVSKKNNYFKKKNYGLAKNIVNGVDYVLKREKNNCFRG